MSKEQRDAFVAEGLRRVRQIWSQFVRGYFGDVECQEMIIESLLDLYRPDKPAPAVAKRWRCGICGIEGDERFDCCSFQSVFEVGPVVAQGSGEGA